jgi:glutathione S-transferase
MLKPIHDYRLIIGNRNYSTWSLRGWLVMKLAGLPFDETVVPLDRPETAALLEEHSPSRRVPCLVAGTPGVGD